MFIFCAPVILLGRKMRNPFFIYSLLLFSLCLNVYLIFVQSAQNWLEGLIQSPYVEFVKPSPPVDEPISSVTSVMSDIPSKNKLSNVESLNDILADIELEIDGYEYNEAIILLKPLPVNLVKRIKTYWLSHSKALINQQQLTEAQRSIVTYLDYVLDDVEFHYLYVEVLNQQGLIKEAIEHAYSIQYYLYELSSQDKSIEHARALAHLEIKKYVQEENWRQLDNFCEQVIPLDPTYMAYYWFLAQAEYQQGFYENALANIEPLLEESNYAVKATALQKKIEQLLRSPTQIPLLKQGEHFIVEGYVNDSSPVSLLIDTGASFSMLSQVAFDDLSEVQDVEYVKSLTLNTAGGIIQADLYQVESFTINDFEVENMQFTVSPIFSSEQDGLLGMNFLRQFKFTINQSEQTLSLERK